MNQIELSIAQVEQLYRAITGREPVSEKNPYAAIPPEVDPVRYVAEQMERLRAMLANPGAAMHGAMTPWVPPMELWENEAELLICVELPGCRKESVQLTVNGTVLMLEAHPSHTENGHQLRLSERPPGTLRRTIPLPPGTRTSGMHATLQDGVLQIRIPRESPQAAQPQAVPVT